MFGLRKLFGSIMGSAEAKAEKQAVERRAQDFKDLYKQPPTFDIPVTLSHEHGFIYNDEIQKIQNTIYKAYESSLIYGTSTITMQPKVPPPEEVYTESQKEIGKAFKIKKYLEPKEPVMIGIDWVDNTQFFFKPTNRCTIAHTFPRLK